MIRNTKSKVEVFETIEALNKSAANLLIDVAKKSVAERGRFVLCLSGGNTPKSLYSLLSLSPYRDLMPWKNTFVFWGDERCVSLDDESNNAHMALTTLLDKVDIPSTNIFPVPIQLLPAEAAKRYEEALRNFFGDDEHCFDIILLGLGDNGHTASLFPATAVLFEEVHWVKEVFVEEQEMYRITITAPLINKARQIVFLVEGEKKATILKTVLTGSYLPERYPAQLINPTYGEIDWLVDAKAASALEK